jgi:hypothetical protein
VLWHKSWQETQLRFYIGFILLVLLAGGGALEYPQIVKLLPAVSGADLTSELGRRIKEAAELQRTFRGYVWSQWFRQNLPQLGTLFAILIGSGSPIAHGSRGAALFTLSLPASRTRLVAVRGAVGLVQLIVFAFVPSLVLVVMARGMGEAYSVVDVLIHGLCWFVGVSVFFALAMLLSTMFDDLLRPLLVACAIAVVVGLSSLVFEGVARYGIYALMSGETYFRTGAVPWVGLLAGAALSGAIFYAAVVNISARDF